MTDATVDLWATAADTHPVWDLADGSAIRQALVEQVEIWALVAERAGSTLSNDPWYDPEVALRWSTRTADLLNPNATITEEEAALLVGLPFAVQAYWTRAAADSRTPSEQEDLERFIAGYARLARRAEHLADQTAAEAIRAWLLRRWLVRRPELYTSDRMIEVLGNPNGALPAPTLASALRVLHRGPTGLAEDEQTEVRTPVLLLALAAHRMALDPVSLSDVIVDHLGIADPVHPSDLRTTLREATWQHRGRTVVLGANCLHQAVDVALGDQVQGVAAVLSVADAIGDDPTRLLVALPAQASADGVAAAVGDDGFRAYTGHGFRFRLADDRVQELLMGEQLYGDRALAIRELYQNALDACRYRQARLTYLDRTGSAASDIWAGNIEFRTGQEDGRSWIDCVDNGVGMGTRELVDVFSNAGVRFADLPEFVQEQADWAKVGIELHPNSRFGIGVLSYFMLADEITVTTCRMDRMGRPGRLLRVSIAGPGALARIQDLGPGTDAGTTVRLHLRPGDPLTSPVDLLRRLLWVAPFQVTASDAMTTAQWFPNTLAETARVGTSDPALDDGTTPAERAYATKDSAVWWTSGTGAVLADGLWVSTLDLPAVVNLTGAYAPQLTVDRRRAEAYDRGQVRTLLRDQIPALFPPHHPPLTGEWLRRLAAVDPDLADRIADEAVLSDHRWLIGTREIPARLVGCFPADWGLFAPAGPDTESVTLPDPLGAWRVAVWAAAGLVPGLGLTKDQRSEAEKWPLAVPSDALVASREIDGASPWFDNGEMNAGPVLRVSAALGKAPAIVAKRLAELGRPVKTPPAGWPDEATHTDVLLLSKDLDGRAPWLTGKIRAGEVYRAAVNLDLRAEDVASRLKDLGLRVAEETWRDDVTAEDLILLSRDHDGKSPWLRPGARRTIGDVVAVAARIAGHTKVIADRMRAFGQQVDDEIPDIAVNATIGVLLSRDVDGVAPWLNWDEAAQPSRPFVIAEKLKISVGAAADSLRAIGLDVPPVQDVPNAKLLSSVDLDARGPWLSLSHTVPSGHILAAAAALNEAPAQVAKWLVALGYVVPDVSWPESADQTDLTLLSRSHDRVKPWLKPGSRLSMGHVLAAVRTTRLSPQDVVERLNMFGHPAPEETLPDRVRRKDLRLLSRDLDAQQPWRKPGSRLTFSDLVKAAGRDSLRETARRARNLGLRVKAPAGMPDRLSPDDLVLMSRDLDGTAPFRARTTQTGPAQIVRAALRIRCTPESAEARLRLLGYPIPDRQWPADVSNRDLIYVSRDLDAAGPWLDRDIPASALVPRGQRTLAEVRAHTARMIRLGLALPKGFVFDGAEGVGAKDVL